MNNTFNNNNNNTNFENIIKKQKLNFFTEKHILLKKDYMKSSIKNTAITGSVMEMHEYLYTYNLKYQHFSKEISEHILKMISKCIIENSIILKKDEKKDIIPLNYMIKNIYQSLRNKWDFNNDSLKSICLSIVKYYLKKSLLEKKNIDQKKYKLTWVIVIERKDILDWFKFYDTENTMTYNIPPKDWQYMSDNIALNIDDQFTLLTNGKYYQENYVKKIWNEEYINKINLIQKMGYKLDINLFENIFEKISLLDYYAKKKKKICIKDMENYNEYIINNIERYISNNILNLEYIIKNAEKINKQTNNEEIEITPTEKIILNFLYNYDRNSTIYHYITVDYRGRMYNKGAISFISSKLYRFLIKLDGNNIITNINDFYIFYIANQIKKVYTFKEAKEVYKNLNSFKDSEIKNIMNLNKIIKFKNTTINIDASASIFQIIGALLKNNKLLKYTNLYDNTKVYDIYEYIIEIIKERIDANKMIFIDFYTSRKIVKYSIMTFVYGSQPLYIAKALINNFKINNIMLKDLTEITNFIIKTFNKEFPIIQIYKNLIKKYINKKKNFDISMNTLIKEIQYTIPKEKKIKIKAKEVNISFTTESEKPDLLKIKKSTFVNIMHNLDSECCLETRTNLKKLYNINSLSIHDNFIIDINNYERCVKEYNKQLERIYKTDIFKILPDFKNVLTHNYCNDKKTLENIKKLEELKPNNTTSDKILNANFSLQPE